MHHLSDVLGLFACFGMIHLLIGKPRNGKSLRAMMHIIEQLTTTHRVVVTNMVIDLDALQLYLDAMGHSIFVRSRVFMLTDAETKHFWLYRGQGYVLPKPDNYDAKAGADVDYTPLFVEPRFRVGGVMDKPDGTPQDLCGVAYIIDEIHTHWPARGWQGTPRHADFYNSQHGKLNDEVWFITQNLKLCDPNFYRLGQDFTYCRNHRLEKHGWFRGDNKFEARTYGVPPASPYEVTLNTFTYHLDLAVARCYDTSAGVGMPGGGTADAGRRAKGVPLKMVWVALGVVLVLAWLTFTYGLPMITNHWLKKVVDPAHQMGRGGTADIRRRGPSKAGMGSEGQSPFRGGAEDQSVGERSNAGRGLGPASVRVLSDETGPGDLRLEGYVMEHGSPVVFLSDGTVLGASDLQEVDRQSVVLLDGRRIRYRTRQERRTQALADQGDAAKLDPTPLPPAPPQQFPDDRSAPKPAEVPKVTARTPEEISGGSARVNKVDTEPVNKGEPQGTVFGLPVSVPGAKRVATGGN